MAIPSTNSQLLVTEDWKKIYQSFRNADFQSYDFESIRRILISYLQENYPEDFNDYIDSSEYIALVDLIAYLGQNLSFRIDLNARENFLETAQRRDSILRLAQLISYVPKRNVPASGLLKVTAISTTENVVDATGVNLSNTPVVWSDPTNSNWYQQFVSVINAAMPGSMVVGKPNDRAEITGMMTEQYLINSSNTDVPIFSFTKNVNGTSMTFELVPATFSGKTYIYEDSPQPAKSVSLIYQDDNQGSSSGGTGFFALFKQGNLSISNFTIDHPVTNEIIGINSNGINDSDVWLWQLDAGNKYSTLWTQTPSTVGNNVIYNSLNSSVRTVYSVTSRDNDQIDLNFADGSFGDLPKGSFVLYYRQSNGLTYAIKPEQLSGISIKVPYVNKVGQPNTLTLTLGLQYTVTNSSGPETNQSIQLKAPQAYYTQNRMVTGEDYNIAPLSVTSNVLKVKSIARSTSGISKYFELSDVSGKYSSTNVFATDGVLYKNTNEKNFSFSFSSQNEIFSVIKKQLEPVLADPSLAAFYYDQYRKSKPISPATAPTPAFRWNLVNTVSGQSRGYFRNVPGSPASVGTSAGTGNPLSYVSAGTVIKFIPPTGYYFLPNGKITTIQSTKTSSYIWTSVLQIVGDGANYGLGALGDGTGPVILSDLIPNNSIIAEIIPPFVDAFTYSFENDLSNLCLTQRNFGLRFDSKSRMWKVILDSNLDLINPFSFDYEGNNFNTNKDSSWMIAFSWQGDSYKVRYRLTDFIFHSVSQTGFFVDSSDTNFDYTTNRVIKDKIDVLSINSDVMTGLGLGVDYSWQVNSAMVESDGYVDPSKVKVSFYNHQGSGQISQKIDPDSFNKIVGSLDEGTSNGYVLFQLQDDGVTYKLADNTAFVVYNNETTAKSDIAQGINLGNLFYIVDTNVVKSVNGNSLVYEPRYIAYSGRENLKFHYQHNSGQERRIDPSKSNIIDVYMLTSAYDNAFRNWLLTQVGTEPTPPTSQELENNYSASLEPIKTISDEIVYQPVTYKVLFGSTAPISLQAKFKAVQNPASTASANDIISRILTAINNFFALENWDFGQSFHFSELSAYVMNLLTPDITNFVIVPTVNNFGSLYEIACQSNEIFISGATAADISVISAMTASQLNVTSIVTNSSN